MSLDLLIVLSTDRAAGVFVPLARAAARRRVVLGCFFTNDGVKLLADAAVQDVMRNASVAVACEHSWERNMKGVSCPVDLGSQTDHSALVAQAARVVAL